ncbi:MAG: S-layer homology domain-containing protein, partial [Gammaproteobacteria bacterium]|nr:S-layer homology domain-containing protein [Gammaproteobacteria bacterium]
TNVNGTLYFQADDGTNGFELWTSDGTAAGTVLVKDINPTGDSFPQFLTNVSGTLYFRADDGTHGVELWKSDGTASGTTIVKDIASGSGDSDPVELTPANGILYFAADVSGTSNDFELWKSDGTAGGTLMVKDINSGGGSINPISFIFGGSFTNVNGTLFFSANDGSIGNELWKSDGSASGTVLVKDINPAGTSDPQSFALVNNTIYFSAFDGSSGRELWKSDGTASGTIRVRDISSMASSVPNKLTDVNGTLYFSADATGMGNDFELWKSDGTDIGTVLVKNIAPSGNSSFLDNLTNLNGVLYFSVNDGSTGSELWRAYVRTDTPPVFDDVPLSHPFYNAITNFAISGYTSGCSVVPSLYCPSDPVTRAQMAIFLLRGIAGQDFSPDPAQGNVFNDVSTSSFAASWIEEFKTRQVTGGCSANPPLYCPDDPITRTQMAVFLLKVIHGSAYTPPPGTGTLFTDVNVGDFALAWIEQLAKENITGGCGNGNFCPNDPVTRGQMAAFLTRVFHTPQLFE